MVEHCPHCQRPIIKRPLKEATGKIIWKNLFYMDAASFLFFISILFLLLGFWQITGECKTYLADPCGTAVDYGCTNIYSINGTPLKESSNIPKYDFTIKP